MLGRLVELIEKWIDFGAIRLDWPKTTSRVDVVSSHLLTSFLAVSEDYMRRRNRNEYANDEALNIERKRVGSLPILLVSVPDREKATHISTDEGTKLILIICHFIPSRDLRCLRNTIHTHLLITYITADLLWIVTATLQVDG